MSFTEKRTSLIMSIPGGPMAPIERTVKLNCSVCGKPTRSHRDGNGNVYCHICWLERNEQGTTQATE